MKVPLSSNEDQRPPPYWPPAAHPEWDYHRYLASAEWKSRRERVMERAGGLCEACRVQPATEVHHLTYAHIGNEALFELVAICRPCHQDLSPAKARLPLLADEADAVPPDGGRDFEDR
jgi:hypothetical protein